MKFTPEELEEMRKADAEIDESFQITTEERRLSEQIDFNAKLKACESVEARKKMEHNREYLIKNREQINAKKHEAYTALSPEEKAKRAAYAREWRKKNPEKARANWKAQWERDPERMRENQRRYYQNHRDECIARVQARRKKLKEAKKNDKN